eukprot:365443-Chlamydomonas_euryale.AAC.21
MHAPSSSGQTHAYPSMHEVQGATGANWGRAWRNTAPAGLPLRSICSLRSLRSTAAAASKWLPTYLQGSVCGVMAAGQVGGGTRMSRKAWGRRGDPELTHPV